MGLLTQTAEPAKEMLGVETIDVVADRGYFKIEDIEACEKAGMTPYVPRPQRGPSVSEGLFPKDEFQLRRGQRRLSFARPVSVCIRIQSRLRGLKKINYVNKLACDDCALRSRCTQRHSSARSRGWRTRPCWTAWRLGWRRARTSSTAGVRRVEHPFGSIKQWMNQGAFLMRRLEKVRGEFSLTALAYNLRRVLNLVGFAELMAAVAA